MYNSIRGRCITMKREAMFNIISDELAKIKVLIDSENSLNLNNKNIFLEDIMANIFNMLYDLSLINTNLSISNYASIDLHDTYKKIAIQVTTNVSRKKIQDTKPGDDSAVHRQDEMSTLPRDPLEKGGHLRESRREVHHGIGGHAHHGIKRVL